MTRVLVISDTHCGAQSGLTPPPWQRKKERDDIRGEMWLKLQRATWRKYARLIESLQPIDVCLDCGDVIDGRGARSGGVEQITTELDEQTDIALYCRKIINPKRGFAMVAGTGYHCDDGNGNDWDKKLADVLGAKFGDHLWPLIDGVQFDIKHHIGGTNTVNGGDSTCRNEINSNVMWHLEGVQPLADILIRAHVHRRRIVDNCHIAPSLQTWTRYGSRRRSNVVHWGLMWYDIDEKGEVHRGEEITPVKEARCKPIKM